MTFSPPRTIGLALGVAAVLGLMPFSAAYAAPAAPIVVADDPFDPTPSPGEKEPATDPDIIVQEGGDEWRQQPTAVVVVPAAAANDNYASATTLASTNIVEASGSLIDATIQSGEPTTLQLGKPYYVASSVWFKWTAPASGAVTIDTAGSTSNDTTLALFTGSKMSSAKRIAANDDDGGNFRSRLTSVKVKKGTTYHIQVGSQGASTPNDYVLHLRGVFAPPSNDLKANAVDKSSHTTWSTSTSTFGATIEPVWEPTNDIGFPGYSRYGSQWYKWTPTVGGSATIDTNGSAGDTYLAVFKANNASAFAGSAFSDTGGNTPGAGKLSGLLLEPNFTYYIQVGNIMSDGDGFGVPGKLKLNFTFTATGPTISKVSPSSGPMSGGTTITITGTRFTGANDVEINGVNATSFTVVNSKKITAVVPSSATTGKKVVQVFAGGFGSRFTSKTFFTYKPVM